MELNQTESSTECAKQLQQERKGYHFKQTIPLTIALAFISFAMFHIYSRLPGTALVTLLHIHKVAQCRYVKSL